MTERPSIRTRLKRFLRSPATITAELVGLALLGAASTAIPQASSAPEELAALAERAPVLHRLVELASLDRIVHGPLFLGLLAVSVLSLAVVLWELWRRALRGWRGELRAAAFGSAPFRIAFVRPATGAVERATFRTTGRLGTLGSPLFHLGLLLVVLAGIVRGLLGADAVVDLYEGETLPPGAHGWALHDRGVLASPVALGVPVRVEALRPGFHAGGALAALEADVSAGAERATIAINAPLEVGGARLYLSGDLGAAAFVAVAGPDGDARRAVLLRVARGAYRARIALARGLELDLAATGGEAGPPGSVEVRAFRGDVLLGVGRLAPGASMALPGGEVVTAVAIRWWARVLAARDPSTWLLLAGFVLGGAGAVLIFAVTRVDAAIVVTPVEGGEQVLVALRPQRLAPLYADRFARLVERVRNGEEV